MVNMRCSRERYEGITMTLRQLSFAHQCKLLGCRAMEGKCLSQSGILDVMDRKGDTMRLYEVKKLLREMGENERRKDRNVKRESGGKGLSFIV